MPSPVPIRTERTQAGTLGPTEVEIGDILEAIRGGCESSEQQLVVWFQPGVMFFLKRASLLGVLNKVDVSEIFRLAIFFIKTGAIADGQGLRAMLVKFSKNFGGTRPMPLLNTPDAQVVSEAFQMAAWMREALSEISVCERDAFVARYVEGKTTDEICRELNITIEELTEAIDTVRTLYAGRRLRKSKAKSTSNRCLSEIHRSGRA